MEKQIAIHYYEYDGIDQLADADRRLFDAAVAACDTAYAPYSGFHVGAAALLADGNIVTGSNQENAAYPSGLCAERTALFAASAAHPGVAVVSICVVARRADGKLAEAAPCGACLQVMAEIRHRQGSPLATLIYLDGGRFRKFTDVDALLPFGFVF